MYDMSTSVIIPSRNEPYLQQTIQDLLYKATGEIEIIAVLEGYWPPAEEIVSDPRVTYIHFSKATGMRNAINSAASIAKGEYLLKIDAHCIIGEGYDEILAKDCDYDWVVVPRRYPLDVKKWQVEERSDDKYPVDYMYLSKDLHGVVWKEKNNDPELYKKQIDDLMSSQGSCWFMKKTYFYWLELMDEENYGSFASEFQEIGLKTWLSGGKVKVNKGTWYAHWHKTEGRGYSLNSEEADKGSEYTKKWKTERIWRKQRHELDWLINKFMEVPTWEK